LGAVAWRRAGSSWVGLVKGVVRSHHDHFRWDINRPGFAENRHRTDAADVAATLARQFSGGRRAIVGLSAGVDRVTSSNLGDHTYSRASLFGELVLPLNPRTTAQLGLRADEYSTFGRSVSPSIALSVRATPGVRLHAAVSRAFRVPTFTELYYSDPGNLGSPALVAERGWSLDTGADWTRGSWTLSLSPFWRSDENVIDWTRAEPTNRWRSTNVRDVTTRGFESGLIRRWNRSMVRLHYGLIDVDAPALNVLSKYVLEYVRHQGGASVSVPLGDAVRLAVNVDHRARLDGQTYQLVSARLSCTLLGAEIFVDGTNLLNESYREIAGVAMPGRWVTAGISIR
jgi:iron complex outermembrane receptor protein